VEPEQQEKLHPALPCGAEIAEIGELVLGGCGVRDLAARFGTPVYVYDRAAIRASMQQAVEAMGDAGSVHYAAKAYLARWPLEHVAAEGLGLDVSSGGELGMALAAGFPAARIRLHGNNKQRVAIRQALEAGIGAVVVDGLQELELVIAEAERRAVPAPILLRLNPGIEAHTHRYLQTGVTDSKFGLSIAGGDAARAVERALCHHPSIRLLGYHAHIGTQILDLQPYRLLMRALIAFARQMHEAHGFWPEQLSPGGGIGIAYTDETPPTLTSWIATLREELSAVGDLPVPRLGVEPGRALVGPAGVALYRAGAIKAVPGGRTYVAVDGGMADNIRPALYDARYAALAATRMHTPSTGIVTIAGPYCESGDILVRDTPLPPVVPDDLIALPAAGAYCLPMSSNYNAALRPAVVVVEAGAARLVQRRQTLADLLALDVSD
jgi:diaminopimelate decarboxylase